MIRIDHVNHSIGGTQILHDITTVIPANRLTALIGPNGAGKSTLLRLIGRLEPLQAGRIAVAGHDVARTPTGDLARIMAILGQQTAIASRLRVAELVAFGRWPHHHGRPGPRDVQAVTQALAAFDLIPLADRFLDEVSGGQAQRAHIAMAFAQDTPWLLLDEPLNNLDMAHSRALMARIGTLVHGHAKGCDEGRGNTGPVDGGLGDGGPVGVGPACVEVGCVEVGCVGPGDVTDRTPLPRAGLHAPLPGDGPVPTGRSVAIVVHEINYAAAWADHIVAMKQGRIVAEGHPDAVLTAAVLSDLYDTPVAVGRHKNRPLILHHI